MLIEKIIQDYLSENLDVDVYMEMPERPSSQSFVIIEKEGGSKTDKIPTSMFAFQSYGASLYEAAELNQDVEDALEMMKTLDAISGVQCNASGYNFTDPETKQYRYQCVYDITHY